MTDLFEGLRDALAPGLRLDRELGGGGMARVFVATDPSLERAVVVKVLPPERAATLSAERFRREILIAAALSHPNIVPVLAAGTADGLLWYSMPFVAGKSLRARIAEGGALSVGESMPVLRDVARALAFAHRAGVVHRDIKPDNVLLTTDGAATVTDFGIAKAIDTARTGSDSAGDTSGSLTQAGNSIGTPHYMAPEQIAGESLIDGRADLYAFGMMAYEMLAGRRPFDDRPAAQVLVAHLTEDPAPIASLVPSVPKGLAALIHRCLAKDPARRPASADEVVSALDASASTGSQPRFAPPRSTRLLIGGGVAVAALATAAFLWLKPATKPLDPGLIVIAPFRVIDGQGDLGWLREGMLDLLSTKITGEIGVKAVDPRASLARFRAIGGGAAVGSNGGGSASVIDASVDQAIAVARALGAGRLLLGEVLPDSRGLALHATLVDASTGAELQRFDGRAGRDSIIHLADQLGAQLLTRLAGKAARNVALLEGVPLDALRPYLEGSSLLRRMHAQDAAKAFGRALDVDSTFGLAGLGQIMSLSWFGGSVGRERAVHAAWAGREKLPARERALLSSILGPRYPARSSSLSVLRAREEYVTMAPDSPEAAYLLADQIFHYGPALGIADAMQRAEDGFKRAFALDESYLVGSEHLMEITIAEGDEALTDRLLALRQPKDSSTYNSQLRDWQRAVLHNDTAQLRIIEDSSAGADLGWLGSLVDRAVAFDVGVESARRIARASLTRPGTPDQMRQRSMYASRLEMISGDAAMAVTLRRQSGTSPDDPMVLAEFVRVALVADGDRAVAEDAVRRLATLDAAPLVGDDSTVIARREATRAIGLWRLAAGDTTRAARDIARLREAFMRLATPEDRAQGRNLLDAHIELFEALRAAQRDTAQARRGREQLNLALDSLDWSGVTLERSVAISLMASRLFEQAGDERLALHNAMRTRVRNGDTQHPYIAVQRRLVERLRARLSGGPPG